MRVAMILPALTEATSPLFRPIKYSLFPPLGLATLAGYLNPDDDVRIVDEHVEKLDLNDTPQLVVIQAYITSARRSYRIADVPNSIVVSRGCPYVCDFCYKEAFFQGGRSFYTQSVDAALAEIDRLPGRHLYFLDDHLFGDRRFATALFEGMRGMRRLWQAAGTVNAVLAPDLLERAVESGLRSLFVGFESLSTANLLEQRKFQNLRRDYNAAIRRLHDLGVMVNGSFVFGMDGDDASVFGRTVEWAIDQGIETATFHILTAYLGMSRHNLEDA